MVLEPLRVLSRSVRFLGSNMTQQLSMENPEQTSNLLCTRSQIEELKKEFENNCDDFLDE